MEKSREKAINILEIFEDYLESKGVVITNKDKEEYGGNGSLAILFGCDYYDLEDKITEIIKNEK